MAKTLRKNRSRKNGSKNNKKTKKNVKHYYKKNSMRGGVVLSEEYFKKIIDDVSTNKVSSNNVIITQVNIVNNGLTNEHAFALAKALKTNTTITSIDLSNNKISDKGALAILESITKTKEKDIRSSVTSLYFNNNDIGNVRFFSSKMRKILKILARNYSITMLKLEGNNNIEQTDKKTIEIFIARNNYLNDKLSNGERINQSNYKEFINEMHSKFQTKFSNDTGLLRILKWSNYDIDLKLLELQLKPKPIEHLAYPKTK